MIQGGGEDDRPAPKDGSASWWTFDSGPESRMHPGALADVIGVKLLKPKSTANFLAIKR